MIKTAEKPVAWQSLVNTIEKLKITHSNDHNRSHRLWFPLLGRKLRRSITVSGLMEESYCLGELAIHCGRGIAHEGYAIKEEKNHYVSLNKVTK